MTDAFDFVLTAEDVALGRLDRVLLAHAPRSSRAFVAAAFAAGEVRVDGRVVKKSDAAREGARLVAPPLAEREDRAVQPEPDAPLTVVREDARLVAFNKPAGQPCNPVTPGERGTLAAAALARYPELAGIGGDDTMPGMLHRLDAGTSGLVLAARDAETYEAMRKQISAQEAVKVYVALVRGAVREAGGLSGHLAHCTSFRGRMRVVNPKALPRGERAFFAETFWKPIGAPRPDGTTLVEATIRTGVTHQIRCQLAAAGHPIVGDTTYGTNERPLRTPWGDAHCLHALSITFRHPADGAPTTWKIPMPAWAK